MSHALGPASGPCVHAVLVAVCNSNWLTHGPSGRPGARPSQTTPRAGLSGTPAKLGLAVASWLETTCSGGEAVFAPAADIEPSCHGVAIVATRMGPRM